MSPTRTPALWRLAETGSVGVASVRAVPQVSCPVDGWLTLGAGNRARGPRSCPTDLAVGRAGGGAQVGAFAELRRVNLHLDVRTDVASLAATLGARGECATAVGPGAAVAAADPVGHVGVYADQLPDAGALPAFLDRCPVTVVAADVATVDEVVNQVQASRAPGSVVLVVGISELPGSPAPAAQLHPAVANGPGLTGGALVSASTGRTPYVQLIDVAPTVLSLLGDPVPAAMVGEPWRATTARGSLDARIAHLADLALLAKVQHAVTPPAFAVVVTHRAGLLPPALVAAASPAPASSGSRPAFVCRHRRCGDRCARRHVPGERPALVAKRPPAGARSSAWSPASPQRSPRSPTPVRGAAIRLARSRRSPGSRRCSSPST